MVSININSFYLTRNGSVVEIYSIIPTKGKLIYPEPTEAFHEFIKYIEGGRRFRYKENSLDLIKEINIEDYPEYFV